MYPQRPNNNQKFIDFPDNPDLYGKMNDPNPLSLGPQRNPTVPPPQEPRIGNFAPPGSLPPIGSPSNPMFGIDGQGSDLMVCPPKGNKPFKGDTDIMYAKGQIPPPPGYGFDPDMPYGNPQLRNNDPFGMGPPNPNFGGPSLRGPGFGGGFGGGGFGGGGFGGGGFGGNFI